MAPNPQSPFWVRYARKAVIGVVGGVVTGAGVLLIPFPGPGTLVFLLGLAILSLEFSWADRLRRALRRRFDAAVARVRTRPAAQRPRVDADVKR